MDWHGPEFVIVIIAISTAGWVINNWIRARHGYAPSDEWGRTDTTKDQPRIEQLTSDNQAQDREIARLHERIAVLERIATDPATRTARDIAALR
jgi:hypothetical protein